MREYAFDLWSRAIDTLQVVEKILCISPDSAASRAYYAAFYAVSSLFALQNKTFKKHSEVESSVHRDLVKQKIWPKELGRYYSDLVELRSTGDYGGIEHITKEEAQEAFSMAEKILKAVESVCPELPVF